MTEARKQVFLMYSHADVVFARSLAQAMEDKGASVFFDIEDLGLGADWAFAVRHELERSAAVVLVVPSENFEKRNYIRFEVGAAKALGKTVLGVVPPGQKRSAADQSADIADVLLLDADTRPVDSIAEILVHAVPETDLREFA